MVAAAAEDVADAEAERSEEAMIDRVGIGWRPELAAGILSHLDEIDVVEVIADDYFEASGREVRALKTLSRQVPVMLHGVSLGLASTARVERRRLSRAARLLEKIPDAEWSEHLAFVRGGGTEIGHLACPPRSESVVDGTAENLHTVEKEVGRVPLLENIATLVEPPGSTLTEEQWISKTLATTGIDLLLDLHNLFANSENFGFDPFAFLDSLPEDRFPIIHISGGTWIGPGEDFLLTDRTERRLLDDHLHDVPDRVYDLLRYAAVRSARPLSVILERDGYYPPMPTLLAQLSRARAALQEGRSERTTSQTSAR